MDSYRKRVLKPVAKKFREAIIPARPSRADDSERLKAKADSLWEITRQFQVLDDALPVWPLRLRRSIAPSSLGHRIDRGEDACHGGEQRGPA
jgi:hypothetical protein